MPDPVRPRASGAHAATGTSSTAAAGSSDQHGDSTVELVSTAAEQLGQLVRQEIALAQTELSAKAKRAGSAANEVAARSEPSSDAPPDVADLERELARTRAQLGETLDAVQAKPDVRSRAADGRGRPLPAVWGGTGAVPLALAVVLVLRSRRGSRRGIR